jgi:outer membrane protein OmpA-like peptidoglycan-associated protein
VEIVSDPPSATISLRGRAVGSTPRSVVVGSEADLADIVARRPNEDVVERRIRLLSRDRAELFFRFGTDPSPLAKRLGLSRILVIESSERVGFDVGRSTLKADFLPVLRNLAGVLKTSFPNVDVFVCGHTDSTGSDLLNLRLSLERARAVADVLAAEGLPRARLKVQGFGKEFPVETNSTAAGRSANRRAELVLPQ